MVAYVEKRYTRWTDLHIIQYYALCSTLIRNAVWPESFSRPLLVLYDDLILNLTLTLSCYTISALLFSQIPAIWQRLEINRIADLRDLGRVQHAACCDLSSTSQYVRRSHSTPTIQRGGRDLVAHTRVSNTPAADSENEFLQTLVSTLSFWPHRCRASAADALTDGLNNGNVQETVPIVQIHQWTRLYAKLLALFYVCHREQT